MGERGPSRKPLGHTFISPPMNPSLERTSPREEPAVLVVHVVRRAEAHFERESPGRSWVDPPECLLDLQEARLTPQAEQFLSELCARHQRRT